jgi:hypothetical protein
MARLQKKVAALCVNVTVPQSSTPQVSPGKNSDGKFTTLGCIYNLGELDVVMSLFHMKSEISIFANPYLSSNPS